MLVGRTVIAGRAVIALGVAVSAVLAGGACSAPSADTSRGRSLTPAGTGSADVTGPGWSDSATPSIPPAVPPAADIPTISYTLGPTGLPPDPASTSTNALTEALRPVGTVPVYDAPGGQPRALLPADISGVPVTVPIVERRPGWVAVLMPSANRTIGWVPAEGWTGVTLRDHLVLRRQAHELSWYRDGVPQRAWTVTIGAAATQTPLGRTFVLGRSTLPGAVYAGLDVLALGAIPDDAESVPASLRGAHVGIHAWYRDEFGRSISNGCVRVPPAAQKVLLSEIPAGTVVVVVA